MKPSARFNYRLALAVRKDGEKCDAETVERLLDSLDETGLAWLKEATQEEVWSWAFRVLANTRPPLKER